MIATFGVMSLASALMTHLSTPGAVAVAGLAGIVDARAWYGLTAAAAGGYGGAGCPSKGGPGVGPPGYRNSGGPGAIVAPGVTGCRWRRWRR